MGVSIWDEEGVGGGVFGTVDCDIERVLAFVSNVIIIHCIMFYFVLVVADRSRQRRGIRKGYH